MTVATGVAARAHGPRSARSRRKARPAPRARRRRSSGRRHRRTPARCRPARRRRRPRGRAGSPGPGGSPRGWGRTPSSSKYSGTRSTSSRAKTAGAVSPAIPFAASTTTFSRRPADRCDLVEMVDVRRQQVRRTQVPTATDRRGRGSAAMPAPTLVADLVEAGGGRERDGPGEAELEPVVGRRVVRGGDHRGGRVEAAGSEVELVGRGQPDHAARRVRRPGPRRRRLARVPGTTRRMS